MLRAMDMTGRAAAVALLSLAVAAGVAVPWMPCARASTEPAVAGVAAVVYDLAGLVCTQRVDRSFASCGRPWPVCGRCAGLYLGAAFGAVLLLAARKGPGDRGTEGATRRWRRRLMVAAAPTAALWLLEYGAGVNPGNVVRFVGALPLGMTGAAWLAAVWRGDLR
jgi:Predicted membrane protein (DUF2085)